MTTSSSSFFEASMRSDGPFTKYVHKNKILGTPTTENLTHTLQKCPQVTNHTAYCCVCENISCVTFVELLNKTSPFTVRVSEMWGCWRKYLAVTLRI